MIAVEREVGLGGIAETGTRINADLSADLLNTIFWPNSPLHDLGVVVSQGRIAYAGVQFPLAESGELERELGSRHRAAVGMSQESDAVVIVVSEETGDISIAESGKLFRKLTPEGLRDCSTNCWVAAGVSGVFSPAAIWRLKMSMEPNTQMPTDQAPPPERFPLSAPIRPRTRLGIPPLLLRPYA